MVRGEVVAPRGRLAGQPWFPALVLLTGIGPLATDAYLPALPEVGRDLATSDAWAQLSMTTFIVGLALGQLVFGPISDGTGRRRLVLVSSAVFALASVGCALAPQVGLLLVLRLAQGVAGGCGVALGRAVISDRYAGVEAATRYGTLTAVVLLGPVVAPVVGSGILAVGGWRDVFAVLALIGVVMTAGVWLGVPETLPPERRQGHGLRHSAVRMRRMLGDRAFAHTVLVQCLATMGFFVYIGGSSIVLQGQLGIGASTYAAVFATNAAVMSAATFGFRYLVARHGARRLRAAGLAISAPAACALLVYGLTAGDDPGLAPTWVLLVLLVAGNGLTIPAATTLAQEIGRHSGGTASALQGGLTFLAGSLTLPLTGLVGRQTVVVMAAASAVLYLAAVGVLLGPRWRSRRRLA
ncbi:multidrug effflux MFS transporter [Nocardioides acrostichi]|uniref:Multidrug effflux MFS transporter n=1 Tax=Nocardioides acrostichi TaxID=2784339 RepID=A0A930Y7D7_9ACTN|nr:multidrug effflux MFS transporter [Nocardioides acrostichi]MBF4163310.1 multidrug effflux MFS transporter [Nocardioides acrostichi]